MKLQFGNPEQIKLLKDYQEMMEGKIPVEEGEVEFWDYSEGNGRVLFPCENISKADQIRIYCNCIKCNNVVEFIKHYDHQQHYDCICARFENVKCKCETEYRVDDENYIWVVL